MMKKVYDTNLALKNPTIYETIPQEYCLRISLYEWRAIWSKCFGKVLLINGTSSSGKTTICKYLSNFGFNLISVDELYDNVLLDFLDKFSKNISYVNSFLIDGDAKRILSGYKVKEDNYSKNQLATIEILQDEINHIVKHNSLPNKIEIYHKIYEKAKKYIFSGQDVVIDILVNENSLNMLSYCFNYYPMKVALLYCSLEENLEKCFSRNSISLKTNTVDFRYPAMIVDQYNKFYSFVSEDSVSKEDNVIEMVNKDNARIILEVAKSLDYDLFLHIKEIRYREKYHYYEGMNDNEVVQWMHDKVAKIENDMMLGNLQKLYIVPKVRCDFILKSPYLEYINNFILNISNFDQTILPAIIGNTSLIGESEYGESVIDF